MNLTVPCLVDDGVDHAAGVKSKFGDDGAFEEHSVVLKRLLDVDRCVVLRLNWADRNAVVIFHGMRVGRRRAWNSALAASREGARRHRRIWSSRALPSAPDRHTPARSWAS